MSSRRLIMLLTFVLYIIQVTIVFSLRLISPTDHTLTSIVFDVSGIVVMAALDYAIMRYLLVALTRSEQAYSTDLNEQLEQMLASYQLEAQREDELVRQLVGELSSEIALARDALSEHAVERMGKHLQTGLSIASEAPTTLCDNIAIAAVLDTKQRLCNAVGVHLESHVVLPAELPLTDVEAAAIFFNLIDNAIHACEKLRDEGYPLPTVSVQARIRAGQLFVEVANPCREHVSVRHQSALLRDRTVQRHGLGTQIVEGIVAQHSGISDFSESDGIFTAAVMIPCA